MTEIIKGYLEHIKKTISNYNEILTTQQNDRLKEEVDYLSEVQTKMQYLFEQYLDRFAQFTKHRKRQEKELQQEIQNELDEIVYLADELMVDKSQQQKIDQIKSSRAEYNTQTQSYYGDKSQAANMRSSKMLETQNYVKLIEQNDYLKEENMKLQNIVVQINQEKIIQQEHYEKEIHSLKQILGEMASKLEAIQTVYGRKSK